MHKLTYILILLLLSSCSILSKNHIKYTIPIEHQEILMFEVDSVLKDFRQEFHKNDLKYPWPLSNWDGNKISSILHQSNATYSYYKIQFENNSQLNIEILFKNDELLAVSEIHTQIGIEEIKTKYYANGEIGLTVYTAPRGYIQTIKSNPPPYHIILKLEKR